MTSPDQPERTSGQIYMTNQLDVERGLRAVLDEIYDGESSYNDAHTGAWFDDDIPFLVEIFQKAAVNEKKDV